MEVYFNNIFFGGYSMKKILVLILGLYSGLYTAIDLHAMQNPQNPVSPVPLSQNLQIPVAPLSSTQIAPNIFVSACLYQGPGLRCGYYAFYHAKNFLLGHPLPKRNLMGYMLLGES